MTRISLLLALVVSIVFTASGCATNTSTSPVFDPYESSNRKIYAFNTGLDVGLLEPAARTYRFFVADPIEDGVGNVFSNIGDVTVFVNAVLQGKLKQAASDAGRFLVNSTIGIAGIFDVGSRIGLPKHKDSFGQTLGVWGVGEGPFLMLPFLGPSNGRATAGRIVDGASSYLPNYLTNDSRVINTTRAIGIIDTRAQFLSAGKLLEDALDPYQLLRDVWVKNHREQTFEGKREVSLGEDFDEFEEFDDEDDEELDNESEDEAIEDSSIDGSSTSE
ncbi:MAG: VacJ family lipoprotein [Granulosicoccaceae bacterium]